MNGEFVVICVQRSKDFGTTSKLFQMQSALLTRLTDSSEPLIFVIFFEIRFGHLQTKPLDKISPKLNTKLFRCIQTDPKNKILSELLSSVVFCTSKTAQILGMVCGRSKSIGKQLRRADYWLSAKWGLARLAGGWPWLAGGPALAGWRAAC